MQNEMWVQIPNHSTYFVSDAGRIKSYKRGKWKVLSNSYAGPYPMITLCTNNIKWSVRVHRLVAAAFVPNPDNKPCVNHIDGNKRNNNISNLEWVTHSENEIHSHKVLGKVGMIKYNHKPAFLVVDLHTGIFYDSMTQACAALNRNPYTERGRIICNRKTKRFEYVRD